MLASYPFQDSLDKRSLKRHTIFPNARSEKRKIQAQNDRAATNPIICWINHRKERKNLENLKTDCLIQGDCWIKVRRHKIWTPKDVTEILKGQQRGQRDYVRFQPGKHHHKWCSFVFTSPFYLWWQKHHDYRYLMVRVYQLWVRQILLCSVGTLL